MYKSDIISILLAAELYFNKLYHLVIKLTNVEEL